jgi:hypothetical protein
MYINTVDHTIKLEAATPMAFRPPDLSTSSGDSGSSTKLGLGDAEAIVKWLR